MSKRIRTVRKEGMIPVTEDLMRYAELSARVDAQLERVSGLSLQEQLCANIEITETARKLYLASPRTYGPLLNQLYGKILQLTAAANRTLDSRPRRLTA